MENMKYTQFVMQIKKGGVLFLYTDGVTEAANQKDELFSEARLLSTINNYKELSPEQLVSKIKTEIDRFADGAEQADDITMLGLVLK